MRECAGLAAASLDVLVEDEEAVVDIVDVDELEPVRVKLFDDELVEVAVDEPAHAFAVLMAPHTLVTLTAVGIILPVVEPSPSPPA